MGTEFERGDIVDVTGADEYMAVWAVDGGDVLGVLMDATPGRMHVVRVPASACRLLPGRPSVTWETELN